MNCKLVSILLAFLLISIPREMWAHELKQPLPTVGCDGVPSDAVLELPVPAAGWKQVVCTESGHTLAPVPGDAWLIRQDSHTFALSAESGAEDSSAAKKSYFVSINISELAHQQNDDELAHVVAKSGVAVEQPFEDIVSLNLVGIRDRKTTLYVFVGEEGPVAGLACLSSCDKTVSVSVAHPEIEAFAQ